MTRYHELDGDNILKNLRKAHRRLIKMAVDTGKIDLLWPNKISRYISGIHEKFYRLALCRSPIGYGKREWNRRPGSQNLKKVPKRGGIVD